MSGGLPQATHHPGIAVEAEVWSAGLGLRDLGFSHAALVIPPAAFKPCSISAIMSSMCSMPTESLT
jgi:hypothetical protein